MYMVNTNTFLSCNAPLNGNSLPSRRKMPLALLLIHAFSHLSLTWMIAGVGQ